MVELCMYSLLKHKVVELTDCGGNKPAAHVSVVWHLAWRAFTCVIRLNTDT